MASLYVLWTNRVIGFGLKSQIDVHHGTVSLETASRSARHRTIWQLARIILDIDDARAYELDAQVIEPTQYDRKMISPRIIVPSYLVIKYHCAIIAQ